MIQHEQRPDKSSTNLQKERVSEVAERLYRNRQRTNRAGNAKEDWYKAEQICANPFRLALFQINQPLIRCEKQVIEPIARWTDNADLFRLIERVSPAVEAIGVLAIPCVLFLASQSYQERVIAREKAYQEEVRRQESERLQQQVLRDYFNQLSTLMLELEGDLKDPQNERIRTLTTAATLTVLREPGLDGYRKGQIVRYLSDMSLINTKPTDESSQQEGSLDKSQKENEEATISLRNASLSGANLRATDLSGVDLRWANLENVDFDTARLKSANMRGANLKDSDLTFADLSSTDLRDTALSGAFLSNADFSSADLRGANLSLLPIQGITRRGNSVGYRSSYTVVNLSTGEAVSGDISSLSSEYTEYVKRVTRLRGASLQGANLENALLYGVDLSDASVDKATLSTSILCKTKLPPDIELEQDRDCQKMERIIKDLDPAGDEIGW